MIRNAIGRIGKDEGVKVELDMPRVTAMTRGIVNLLRVMKVRVGQVLEEIEGGKVKES